MNFKTFAIAAAAAASIAIAAPANANAADGFTNTDLVQLAGGKHFGKKHFHGGKHFGWGGHGYHWGWKPYHHGFGGCGYFYKKAKWSGSHYWWKKYKRCVHGYY